MYIHTYMYRERETEVLCIYRVHSMYVYDTILWRAPVDLGDLRAGRHDGPRAFRCVCMCIHICIYIYIYREREIIYTYI